MEDSVEQTTTTKIPNNHTNPSPKFQPVGSGKSGCLGLPVFSFPPFPPSRIQTDQGRPSCLGPSLARFEILTLSSTHPLTHSITHTHSYTKLIHFPPLPPSTYLNNLNVELIIQTLFSIGIWSGVRPHLPLLLRTFSAPILLVIYSVVRFLAVRL
ncbi:hypothetical protein CNYM01_09308 [Colletotrichum nymphaeae SA-01]|uniref:Uncharacterized protein n=1 Tax=Colletotrichum nymphaeae SA-01 TaxID=1460502 RepID=A0A135S877_9PEZI|nr:hypothetical protein CNYM01_09308 [Colletotrichum nymphaeae SA-01]